jgi:hypothetical protein
MTGRTEESSRLQTILGEEVTSLSSVKRGIIISRSRKTISRVGTMGAACTANNPEPSVLYPSESFHECRLRHRIKFCSVLLIHCC